MYFNNKVTFFFIKNIYNTYLITAILFLKEDYCDFARLMYIAFF